MSSTFVAAPPRGVWLGMQNGAHPVHNGTMTSRRRFSSSDDDSPPLPAHAAADTSDEDAESVKIWTRSPLHHKPRRKKNSGRRGEFNAAIRRCHNDLQPSSASQSSSTVGESRKMNSNAKKLRRWTENMLPSDTTETSPGGGVARKLDAKTLVEEERIKYESYRANFQRRSGASAVPLDDYEYILRRVYNGDSGDRGVPYEGTSYSSTTSSNRPSSTGQLSTTESQLSPLWGTGGAGGVVGVSAASPSSATGVKTVAYKPWSPGQRSVNLALPLTDDYKPPLSSPSRVDVVSSSSAFRPYSVKSSPHTSPLLPRREPLRSVVGTPGNKKPPALPTDRTSQPWKHRSAVVLELKVSRSLEDIASVGEASFNDRVLQRRGSLERQFPPRISQAVRNCSVAVESDAITNENEDHELNVSIAAIKADLFGKDGRRPVLSSLPPKELAALRQKSKYPNVDGDLSSQAPRRVHMEKVSQPNDVPLTHYASSHQQTQRERGPVIEDDVNKLQRSYEKTLHVMDGADNHPDLTSLGQRVKRLSISNLRKHESEQLSSSEGNGNHSGESVGVESHSMEYTKRWLAADEESQPKPRKLKDNMAYRKQTPVDRATISSYSSSDRSCLSPPQAVAALASPSSIDHLRQCSPARTALADKPAIYNDDTTYRKLLCESDAIEPPHSRSWTTREDNDEALNRKVRKSSLSHGVARMVSQFDDGLTALRPSSSAPNLNDAGVFSDQVDDFGELIATQLNKLGAQQDNKTRDVHSPRSNQNRLHQMINRDFDDTSEQRIQQGTAAAVRVTVDERAHNPQLRVSHANRIQPYQPLFEPVTRRPSRRVDAHGHHITPEVPTPHRAQTLATLAPSYSPSPPPPSISPRLIVRETVDPVKEVPTDNRPSQPGVRQVSALSEPKFLYRRGKLLDPSTRTSVPPVNVSPRHAGRPKSLISETMSFGTGKAQPLHRSETTEFVKYHRPERPKSFSELRYDLPDVTAAALCQREAPKRQLFSAAPVGRHNVMTSVADQNPHVKSSPCEKAVGSSPKRPFGDSFRHDGLGGPPRHHAGIVGVTPEATDFVSPPPRNSLSAAGVVRNNMHHPTSVHGVVRSDPYYVVSPSSESYSPKIHLTPPGSLSPEVVILPTRSPLAVNDTVSPRSRSSSCATTVSSLQLGEFGCREVRGGGTAMTSPSSVGSRSPPGAGEHVSRSFVDRELQNESHASFRYGNFSEVHLNGPTVAPPFHSAVPPGNEQPRYAPVDKARPVSWDLYSRADPAPPRQLNSGASPGQRAQPAAPTVWSRPEFEWPDPYPHGRSPTRLPDVTVTPTDSLHLDSSPYSLNPSSPPNSSPRKQQFPSAKRTKESDMSSPTAKTATTTVARIDERRRREQFLADERKQQLWGRDEVACVEQLKRFEQQRAALGRERELEIQKNEKLGQLERDSAREKREHEERLWMSQVAERHEREETMQRESERLRRLEERAESVKQQNQRQPINESDQQLEEELETERRQRVAAERSLELREQRLREQQRQIEAERALLEQQKRQQESWRQQRQPPPIDTFDTDPSERSVSVVEGKRREEEQKLKNDQLRLQHIRKQAARQEEQNWKRDEQKLTDCRTVASSAFVMTKLPRSPTSQSYSSSNSSASNVHSSQSSQSSLSSTPRSPSTPQSPLSPSLSVTLSSNNFDKSSVSTRPSALDSLKDKIVTTTASLAVESKNASQLQRNKMMQTTPQLDQSSPRVIQPNHKLLLKPLSAERFTPASRLVNPRSNNVAQTERSAEKLSELQIDRLSLSSAGSDGKCVPLHVDKAAVAENMSEVSVRHCTVPEKSESTQIEVTQGGRTLQMERLEFALGGLRSEMLTQAMLQSSLTSPAASVRSGDTLDALVASQPSPYATDIELSDMDTMSVCTLTEVCSDAEEDALDGPRSVSTVLAELKRAGFHVTQVQTTESHKKCHVDVIDGREKANETSEKQTVSVREPPIEIDSVKLRERRCTSQSEEERKARLERRSSIKELVKTFESQSPGFMRPRYPRNLDNEDGERIKD